MSGKTAGGPTSRKQVLPSSVLVTLPTEASAWLGRGPDAEKPADCDQLAYVVGVMVYHEEQFTQVCLTRSVWNASKEVAFGICSKPLKLLSIPLELGDAPLPLLARWRRVGGGPVVVGPLPLLIRGVAAEVQNVRLSKPQVLQQLPGGVGQPGRSDTALRGGMPATAESKLTCASSQSSSRSTCVRKGSSAIWIGA